MDFLAALVEASWWVQLFAMVLFFFSCVTAIQWVLLPWRLKSISENLKRIADNTTKTKS